METEFAIVLKRTTQVGTWKDDGNKERGRGSEKDRR